MPDISQMRTLLLTVNLGSLAKVAKQLNISSAAVSKQLTKLEKEIGIQLLIRSTRRLELTEIGHHYFQQCKRVLEEVDAADALVTHGKSVPSGSLNVLSARHFAKAYLVPYIKEFLKKYPKIELNLELSERIPDFNKEGIDVVIGMSLTPSGEAIQKAIAKTTYCYCASPEYLKEFGIPKIPEDLINHRYITHSMRRPDDTLEFPEKKLITIHPYIRVNDSQTMLELSIKGLGLVKLHRYVVAKHLEDGSLIQVLPSYSTQEIPIYVAYPERRFVPTKVRVFIDFLLKQL